jgi:hypothetical protein
MILPINTPSELVTEPFTETPLEPEILLTKRFPNGLLVEPRELVPDPC